DYERYLDGFLIKPVTKNMMLQAVESVIYEEPDLPLPNYPSPHEQPLQGISLLLVEDNLTNQLVASELLQQQGATIKIASSGEEALKMLESTAERFDMVLMDIQMPGMDGYQTTREIRKLPKHQLLPIIAMTAHAMSDDITACLAAGMQDHIAKPFDLSDLTTKILNHHKAGKTPQVKQVNKLNLNFDEAALAFCQQHHIELEAAVQRLGYSLTIYINVLKQFKLDLRQALQQLEDKTLTRSNARLLFHSLKGAAGTLGFSNLATLATRLEDGLREHSDDAYQADNQVLDKLNLAYNTATDLLNVLQGEQQIVTEKAPVSSPAQAHQLMTLKQHLNHANMAALPLYQQLAPSL
ncbi:response regulator, partial [Pseudoalteromonas sp. MQS005]|uniref:response regulator n=1 Tax=Pseudoalteromonas sp. MQS005 TaxID=1854052 RepID=UPI0012E9887A